MSEVVTLTWDPPSEFRDNDLYQINYKELENDRKWKLYDEKFRAAPAELDDLPSNTVVVFRVRVIHEEYEGPYSEESNEIRTPVSAACQILQKSAILVKGNLSPPVYTLPMKEERHERVKINKLEFGWFSIFIPCSLIYFTKLSIRNKINIYAVIIIMYMYIKVSNRLGALANIFP